jgi:YD repeat-containing protein
VFYDYSIETGQLKEICYQGADSSAVRWTKTWKDWLGRSVQVELSNPPNAGANLLVQSFYDTQGHLFKNSSLGLYDELHEFDVYGQMSASGLDSNGTLALEDSSPDRLTRQETSIETDTSGCFWEMTVNQVYPKDASTQIVWTLISQKRNSAFPKEDVSVLGTTAAMILDSEVKQTDATHVTTTTKRYIAPSSGLVLKRTTSSLFTNPEDEITLNGKLVCTIDSGGVRQDQVYDDFGRLSSTKDRKGITTISYFEGTAEMRFARTTDRIWSECSYDPLGRVKWMKRYSDKSDSQPLSTATGRFTRFAYNLRGQVEKTWGDVPVPVSNVFYEAADGPECIGRLKEQATYNNGSGWSGDHGQFVAKGR